MLDTTKRGPALALGMVARTWEICIGLGATKLISVFGARGIMTATKAYYGPVASDAGYQGAIIFTHYWETAGSCDNYLAQFDLLRKMAEGWLEDGAIYPPGCPHCHSTYG